MIISLGDRRPVIADSAWIAPTATVVGSVRLAFDVSVWYGATIRGDEDDIDIGAGSNIQDNCVLHTDPGLRLSIGRLVNVGHSAVIHGATVEDGCLIGMGAVLLNGAHIGAGSVIAAGALVPQNAQIPPNSLVIGSPGRVRRETTAEEREQVRVGVVDYIERARTHRAALIDQ